jgi:hypothetical protein
MSEAGAAGLGLTGRFGLTQSDRPVAALLDVLENSPRELIPRELVRRIRAGLRYEDLLAALTIAAVRNVQPYPDVGYKYHSFMVLRSIHLTTEQLSSANKWLPIVWATDYFKAMQAQERATSGWRLRTRPARPIRNPAAAPRALIAALDNWDRDGADAAIVNYAQVAHINEIFLPLFLYGARDLRAIGHKAIAVSNAHSLITLLGAARAEPILRSTVAALQNSDGGPNPATNDLQPDRPWRDNWRRLRDIPASWMQGRDDVGSRKELRAALAQVSPEEAGGIVVELLRHGISAEAIWRALFDTAAELVLRQPGILMVHAQTTANALHYAYRVCAIEQTQQLLLLQCAAFMALFRTLTDPAPSDLDLEALDPLSPARMGVDAIGEIFSDLSAGDRWQAARKSLGYLQDGGDAEALINSARHHLVYHGSEAHDYKFSESVFDTYAHLADSPGRRRYLSAGMAYFKAPAKRPEPIIEETLKLLRT